MPQFRFPIRRPRGIPFHPSIRLRLTLWYGLTLAISLLLFASLLYFVVSSVLESEIDRSIADRSVEVNRSIHLDAAPSQSIQITLPQPNVYAAADTFVQLSTFDGKVVAMSDNLGRRPLPISDSEIEAARDGRGQFETIQINGERLRVLTSPLAVAGRPVGVLQVARAISPIEAVLDELQLVFFGGAALSVGMSMLVGWFLARAALAPIDRVTQTAKVIGESRDFGRRVEYPGPPDEVGRLAATINSMLGQLQAAFAELQAAYSRIEEALAAQRRFVADASHELRTPLTTIRGNAGLLQQVESISAEDRMASLAQIVGESDRMSRLVQQLLTLARADSGLRLRRESVPITPLVRDVVRQAATISTSVEVGLESAVDVSVLGDPDHLKQVLLILVDNALKYTPSGGQVMLGVAAEDGQVRIRVADTGVGIDAEDLPHIFERFYRADRARQAGGTGLGLSIAQWIVTEHGGSIEVASELGRGSTFVVVLPVTPSDEQPIVQQEGPSEGRLANSSSPSLPGAGLLSAHAHGGWR